MSKQYTTLERIRLIQQELALWEYRDPQYAALLDAELSDLTLLFEQENEDLQIWFDDAIEGIDYDIVVPDPKEEKKETIEPTVKESENDFRSNKFYRKIDEIHRALFNNPNSTKEQKEEEIIKQMMARRIVKGVRNRNSGK